MSICNCRTLNNWLVVCAIGNLLHQRWRSTPWFIVCGLSDLGFHLGVVHDSCEYVSLGTVGRIWGSYHSELFAHRPWYHTKTNWPQPPWDWQDPLLARDILETSGGLVECAQQITWEMPLIQSGTSRIAELVARVTWFQCRSFEQYQLIEPFFF